MARVRVSIVFESGARIGPGKVKLLESIRDTGSISAAARDMGMSYLRSRRLCHQTTGATCRHYVGDLVTQRCPLPM
jgi:molybdenum-dependent DNA-binding transcriptional regulator ModE